MKKPVITLLALLMTLNISWSQRQYKKNVFGVNAGISVPYADFAVKKIDFDAGFAGIGPNIDFDFLRYGRYCGLSASIGYTSMFFKENAYEAEYDRILKGYGENSVTAGNYQVIKGLVGFTLKIPEMNHFEVMLVFHLGVALTVHPEVVVTNTELGVINSLRKDVAGSAMGNAGVKINYWLTKKYGVNLNYSLNCTNPGFFDDSGFEQASTLPVRYQNINVGFVINL